MPEATVDPLLLKPGLLVDLTPGQLLEVPCSDVRRRFLAGQLGDDPMVIDLQDIGLAQAKDWTTDPGVLFENIRFVVDPSSVTFANRDKPIGSILVIQGRLAISGHMGVGRRFWIAISGNGPLERNVADNDLVFTRWKIVWGDPKRETELFNFGASKGGTVRVSGI